MIIKRKALLSRAFRFISPSVCVKVRERHAEVYEWQWL